MKKYLNLFLLFTVLVSNAQQAFFRGTNNYVAPVTPFQAPAIVTGGLVLNLDAGNPSSYPGSGTTWTDLSGNGNHGTLFNSPTFTSSSNGGNLLFDVSSKYVSLTPTLLPIGTSDRTIIAFVKTPTSMGGYQHIIHWGSNSNNQASRIVRNEGICTCICATAGKSSITASRNKGVCEELRIARKRSNTEPLTLCWKVSSFTFSFGLTPVSAKSSTERQNCLKLSFDSDFSEVMK